MAQARTQNTGQPTPNFEQMLRTAIDSALIDTWTALPGIVKAFDAEKQTATVTPALFQEYEKEDGTIGRREYPTLEQVPVQFPRGGGFALTHPLTAGESGLVVFASRCIDNWAIAGGVQQQLVRRKHDLSDGFFVPGFSSLKDALTSFNTEAIEIRNEAADTVIKLKDGEIEITGGDIKISGGDIKISGGDIQISGDAVQMSGDTIQILSGSVEAGAESASKQTVLFGSAAGTYNEHEHEVANNVALPTTSQMTSSQISVNTRVS